MRTTLATLVAFLVVAAAQAQPVADHLKCFKVKDSLPKATYTADLDGLVPQNCTVKVPAKMACVPTDKTNVVPTPPGGGGTGTANTFFCYKVKCPKATLPTISGTDQFGTHTATAKPASLICAPVAAAGTTSTTTTPVSTTTTTLATACPAGSAGPGGMPPCTDCMPGTFASMAGSSVCTQCPANTFSSLVGSVSCTPCPAGTTSPPGSTVCT